MPMTHRCRSIPRVKKILCICLAACASMSVNASLECEFSVLNNWGSGATAEVVVVNTGTATETLHTIEVSLGADVTVSSSWAAALSGGEPYLLKPFSWNNQLSPNARAGFGMQLSGDINHVAVQLGGDCDAGTNQPPIAAIGDCMPLPSAYLWAEEFVVASARVSCDITAEDPEGEPVTFEVDWGDGTVDSEWGHAYLEAGTYTAAITVSDGVLSRSASTSFNAPGTGVPGTPLVHCGIDRERLQVRCEDRGSFDPDGRLGYAAFVEGDVFATSLEPLTFSTDFPEEGTYQIDYGMTDGGHVRQQRIYAQMEDVAQAAVYSGLGCEFTLGEAHSYGTEALFTITNTTDQPLGSWTAELLFSGDTQIVNHDSADLIVVDGAEYFLRRTPVRCNDGERCMMEVGSSQTVKLILQGEIAEPAMSGDCGIRFNRPPEASFGECPIAMAAAILYGGEFISSPSYTACAIAGVDPDGDALTYSFNWGDGTITAAEPLTVEAVAHSYVETDDYTLVLTVSDGEYSDQVTKTILGIGATLPPQPLIHCRTNRETLTFNCEDRGSFDPDSDNLGFAAFIDNEAIATARARFSFVQDFEQEGAYSVRYGITDTHNIVEQRMVAQMEDLAWPEIYRGLDCAFSLGDTHDYGTDATLRITNTTDERLQTWLATLQFPGDTQIVYQNNALLLVADTPEYNLTAPSWVHLNPNDTQTVTMILQGDIAVPVISGDCATPDNRPPVVTIANCMELPGAQLYAGEFIVGANSVSCDVDAVDPDGDRVTINIDWGDGTTSANTRHAYVEAGRYTVTASASDGTLTSQASSTFNAPGTSLPGTTLVHCSTDRDNLTVTCEDRGSFDPDSELGYAAFVEDDVLRTATDPISFSYTFEREDTYKLVYGTVDQSHIDEQTIYARMEDIARVAVVKDFDCEYSLGETHDYGTEATFTISNHTDISWQSWYADLVFPEDTQIVRHEGARLFVSDYGYTLENEGRQLAVGDSNTVNMIIQGDMSKPDISGDCKPLKPDNRAPEACLVVGPAPDTSAAYAFSAACSVDPDGDLLAYAWTFGDEGTATGRSAAHSFNPGTHQVTLTVSDGQLSDTTSVELIVQDAQGPLECDYQITRQWETGFTAVIAVTNVDSKPLNDYDVRWEYGDGSNVKSLWNATLIGSEPYIATRVGWNTAIQPNETLSFGLYGSGSGSDIIFSGLCQ